MLPVEFRDKIMGLLIMQFAAQKSHFCSKNDEEPFNVRATNGRKSLQRVKCT